MMGVCLQTIHKEPPIILSCIMWCLFANGSKGAPNHPFMYDGCLFANGSKGAPNHPFMYDGCLFANKRFKGVPNWY